MFNFSFSEILLTVLIALIVFGPKQLPEIAGKLGNLLTKVRRAIADLQNNSKESK